MSFIKRFLGIGRSDGASAAGPEAVRVIMAELEGLPAEEARYLAAFAYVLARVAYADQALSEKEVVAIRRIVCEETTLLAGQAALVVQLATAHAREEGGTQDFTVTRLFSELASKEQRVQALHCVLAVAAADDLIVGEEEYEIRQIARQLGIRDKEFLEALAHYRDKRSVLKVGSTT